MDNSVKGSKGEKSKEHLIKSAARLFLQKGYNATGINEIITSAGLTKGSFYFYFSSKKELALEVAEYYNRLKLEELAKAAEGGTWEAFVDSMIGDVIKWAKQKKNFGCPIAVLGMEIAFLEPDIADRYYTSLKQISDTFAEVLRKSGFSEDDADRLADRACALYEGYLMFYRVSRDINQLEKLLKDMKEIVAI